MGPWHHSQVGCGKGLAMATWLEDLVREYTEARRKREADRSTGTCRCDMLKILHGMEHDRNCPEKGRTLAKWQAKRWRY